MFFLEVLSGVAIRSAFSQMWKDNKNLRQALEAEKRKNLLKTAVASLSAKDPALAQELMPHELDILTPPPSSPDVLRQCSQITQGVLDLVGNDLIELSAWQNKLAMVEADRDRLLMT